ncbi:Pex12 amino terminal region-domain-containing protein [Scheffersomyces amazonensis]|uniref:Pex12 amino terminal region-domain-containing protein n=1 Tax=Scheffersomyces amazonensis TaxID=1078765 RepID=UPI00315C54CB
MSVVNDRALPFADAATIVRAHQKDAYFESSYRTQINEVLQLFKGQRFVNSYPEEITTVAKALYLALTTLIGARTLGEEYVDLIYVNRSGKRIPKILPRIGFILSYAVLPYIVTKIVKKYKYRDEDNNNNSSSIWVKLMSSYFKVLDTILNVHIAVFYFSGEFYSLSKRLFGMRYAFGHNKDIKKMSTTGNYSLLGGIIILQYIIKGLLKYKAYSEEHKEKKSQTINDTQDWRKISDIDQLKEIAENSTTSLDIDLSDPTQLPYIPEASRSCMLCLSPMVNPSAANCGHFFCWDCILDWLKEHPECPLCRQQCLQQHLLPLK